jgi:hypothetical protein
VFLHAEADPAPPARSRPRPLTEPTQVRAVRDDWRFAICATTNYKL